MSDWKIFMHPKSGNKWIFTIILHNTCLPNRIKAGLCRPINSIANQRNIYWTKYVLMNRDFRCPWPLTEFSYFSNDNVQRLHPLLSSTTCLVRVILDETAPKPLLSNILFLWITASSKNYISLTLIWLHLQFLLLLFPADTFQLFFSAKLVFSSSASFLQAFHSFFVL